MRNHLLTLVNLLLLATCGYCVWYLVTQEYHEPKEFNEARAYLSGKTPVGPGPVAVDETPPGTPRVPAGAETGFNPNVVKPTGTTPPGRGTPPTAKTTPPPTSYVSDKALFVPLYSPTPTPTPTPAPTPAPPDLGTAVALISIKSINSATEVEFTDRRAGENGAEPDSFILTVGGPPHPAMDGANRPIPISLISVDLDNGSVVLGYQTQHKTKSMSE